MGVHQHQLLHPCVAARSTQLWSERTTPSGAWVSRLQLGWERKATGMAFLFLNRLVHHPVLPLPSCLSRSLQGSGSSVESSLR